MSFRVSPLKIASKSAPLVCPPDKSVTHRAFLFSLFSTELSVVRNPLLGEDCLASLESVRRLGGSVQKHDDRVEVRGLGIKTFAGSTDAAHPALIDCQNSGTTMRLLSGILAGQKNYYRLFGDASLSQRPMGRVAQPLSQMGAAIHPRGEKKGSPTPPLDILPAAGGLRAISYRSNVASAQVKSAVLLAGLWCERGAETIVIEPSLSRDHTERMLRSMGVDVKSARHEDGSASAALSGRAGEELSSLNIQVGGDPSSAAFWACASVMQNRPVTIRNVLLNSTRLGFAEVLKRMDVDVTATKERLEGGEEIGVVAIKARGSMRATEVLSEEIATLIDEIPMLAVAALWATGTTVFRGVQELRVKESDRLAAIIEFMTSIGGRAWAQDNDLFVEGQGGIPIGPTVRDWYYETLGDHRLAMASIVTADALHREIVLDDVECIKVSYPNFFAHREALAKS